MTDESLPFLSSWLKHHASTRPHSTFVVQLATNERITYGRAWETVSEILEWFSDNNVGKKARVALVARNHWMTYPLLVACELRQATLVPLDPELHRDELGGILKESLPSATIVADDVSLPKVPGGNKAVACSALLGAGAGTGTADNALSSLAGGASDTVVLMIYTSGTTGHSKAVMLTSGNLLADATALASRYQITSDDRFFCTLPTYHMNALMMTGMVPLVGGGGIYLSDVLSFKNAKLFWRRLAEHQITICSLVPSIMALLLKLFPRGAKVAAPQLRFGFCGAAPLSEDTWRQFEAVFDLPIYQGYGLTETTCWAVSTPIDGPRKYETVGVPLPDVCELRVVSGSDGGTSNGVRGDGSDEERVGEVQIRGRIVTPGYYRNKRLNKSHRAEDGYYKTGDLGFVDDDGYLHITGRIKDIIIKNGANVAAKDVEHIMSQHSSVRECKALGIPDQLVGERICVACVLDDESTTTAATLRAWAHDNLSHHMWPDAIELLGYLPKGAAGKVSVRLLRGVVSGELATEIVAALNTWKFKRAQPSDLDAMREQIQMSLRSGRQPVFLAYWGCGGRSTCDPVDISALERLREYVSCARRVPEAAPRIVVIFTDTHARNNRIPHERMEAYFAAVRERAHSMGMDSILLSEIWDDAGLGDGDVRRVLDDDAFVASWETLPLKKQLIEQAAKHVEDGESVEVAAKCYFRACMLDSTAIAARYPSAIFTTYNHPDFDFLLPSLPKVYLHSYKEGTSVKPWFTGPHG